LCEGPGKNFAAGAAAQHDEIAFFHGFFPFYEFLAFTANLTIPRVEDGAGAAHPAVVVACASPFHAKFLRLSKAPEPLSRAA
jgi:hypothetical protein